MGTWHDSDRRDRLPADWSKRRLAALERDGHRCTWVYRLDGGKVRCSARAAEVDNHINNDDHALDNLRSLCHDHHAQKTQAESWASRSKNLAKAKKAFRRNEEHPALAYMKN